MKEPSNYCTHELYIVEIGQAVLELLSFKVGSGNHQREISVHQKFENELTSQKSQLPDIKN